MNTLLSLPALVLGLLCCLPALADARTTSEILESSGPEHWRRPAQENLLYIKLPSGTVVFELEAGFAPAHVDNIRALVAAGYYDRSAIVRSQDNYVVQWANGGDPEPALGQARPALALELFRPRDELALTAVSDRDAYADSVALFNGFPVATDGNVAWLVHCYGMLGVARGAPDTGNATSLYVVNGHAPRHLDRNGTLVGRALIGMTHLSTLPRGTGPLGFYETPEETTALLGVRIGSAMAPADRLTIEVLRTDGELFAEYLAARKHRSEDWFVHPTDAVGICNVPVPARVVAPPAD
jgi:peptidylprolyl isomerase